MLDSHSGLVANLAFGLGLGANLALGLGWDSLGLRLELGLGYAIDEVRVVLVTARVD